MDTLVSLFGLHKLKFLKKLLYCFPAKRKIEFTDGICEKRESLSVHHITEMGHICAGIAQTKFFLDISSFRFYLYNYL